MNMDMSGTSNADLAAEGTSYLNYYDEQSGGNNDHEQSGENNGQTSFNNRGGIDNTSMVDPEMAYYDPLRAKKWQKNQKRKEQRARKAEREKAILEAGGELPPPVPQQNSESSNNSNNRSRPRKRARYDQQSPLWMNSISVIVISNDASYRINEDDLANIRSKLEDAIISDDLGFTPCILHSTIYRNEIKIVCADEVTQSWVESFIPKVEGPVPDHPGYRYISFGPDRNLPKFRIWIPKGKEPPKVLQLIEKCNKGIKASKLHLKKVVNHENGKSCVVAVEVDMLEMLEQVEYQPFCGLGRIRFNPLASNRSLESYTSSASGANTTGTDASAEDYDFNQGYSGYGFRPRPMGSRPLLRGPRFGPMGPMGPSPMGPRSRFMGPRFCPPYPF